MKWQIKLCKIVVFGILISCNQQKSVVCEDSRFVQHNETTENTHTKHEVRTDSIWIIPQFPIWKMPHAIDRGSSSVGRSPEPPCRPPFIVSAGAAPILVATRKQEISSQESIQSQQTDSLAISEKQEKKNQPQKQKKTLTTWHAIFAVAILGCLTYILHVFRKK